MKNNLLQCTYPRDVVRNAKEQVCPVGALQWQMEDAEYTAVNHRGHRKVIETPFDTDIFQLKL